MSDTNDARYDQSHVVKDNALDTPTKRLWSKFAKLTSDGWTRHSKSWMSSQDSMEDSSVSFSEQSPIKKRNGKPPWNSSEGLLSACDIKGERLLDLEDVTADEHAESRKSSECELPSEDSLLHLSQDQIDADDVADECKEFKPSTPNHHSSSPTSPSKVSPVRTPVTENDPLGALLAEEETTSADGDVQGKMIRNSQQQQQPSAGTSPPKDNVDTIKGDVERLLGQGDGGPVLFQSVPKSATFHHGKNNKENSKETKNKTVRKGSAPVEQQDVNKKSIQRSTTMPDTAAAMLLSSSAVANSLSHLSSSLRLPFSRYSPSRFSLKKAADLRITSTNLLENAFSGSKKSNEIILGGINSLKSAATSVAKKIDVIKEAMSATSTPVKLNSSSNDNDEDEYEHGETFSALDWSSNIKDLFSDGSRKGSSANLQPGGSGGLNSSNEEISEELIVETLYGKNINIRQTSQYVALTITMTTCSRCNNCGSVLHDEEIMSGWTADDSNLNTKCHFCEKSTLPFLVVNIYDYRGRPRTLKSPIRPTSLTHSFLNRHNLHSSNTSVNSSSLNDLRKVNRPLNETISTSDNNNSDRVCGSGDVVVEQCEINDLKSCSNNFEPFVLEPITVPYLNPLVLRKELENILSNEGDQCLTKPSFVDQHPIIYWNLVWVFERINITSNLPGLTLTSSAVNKNQSIHPSWDEVRVDQSNVMIKCLWDNGRLHEELGQPMYVVWQQSDRPSSLVSALITERTSVSRNVMQSVIKSIQCNDLCEPMRRLSSKRGDSTKTKGTCHYHSLYRDILYLSLVALGRENIDLETFDREYSLAWDKLRKEEGVVFQICDKPPVNASFRHYFRPLLL